MDKVTDIFDKCLYFTTSKLFRNISILAEQSFAPIGLTPSYAFVLMVIQEEKHISTSEVAQKVGLKPSTITRFADKLVLRELIERRQEGRNSYLISTKKLDKEIEIIKKCWNNLYQDLNKILGKENVIQLNNRIIEASEAL